MRSHDSDSRLDLVTLAERLKGHAGEISSDLLSRWDRIGAAEPWHTLPDDLDHDHLPELIRGLAGASLGTEFDGDLCHRVVDLAADHGAYRASEGLAESLLYREYHLLRRALWEHLTDGRGAGAAAWYAAMRIDTLLGLATSAAVLGWNLSTPGDEERRKDAARQLAATWPLPRTG